MDVQITVQMVIRNACDADDLKHYGKRNDKGVELVSPLMDWIQVLAREEGLIGVIDEDATKIIRATALD